MKCAYGQHFALEYENFKCKSQTVCAISVKLTLTLYNLRYNCLYFIISSMLQFTHELINKQLLKASQESFNIP